MLVRIPGLLDTKALMKIDEALTGAEWVDGKASAHGSARDAKHNLVVPLDHPSSKKAGGLLVERLAGHEGFRAIALPKTILPFKFCRYETGMGYGDHLDLPVMGHAGGAIRSDLSMTVFLSDPADYEGGALVFESDYGTKVIRGDAGEAVVYPSTTLHRVEPVTKGTRLVAITWMQSMVRDAAQRRLLTDLAQVATELEAEGAHASAASTVRRVQYNLLRMWVEQ